MQLRGRGKGPGGILANLRDVRSVRRRRVGLSLAVLVALWPGGAAPLVASSWPEATVAVGVPEDATASNNQVKVVRAPVGLVVAYVGRGEGTTHVLLAVSRNGGAHWSPLARASGGRVPSRLPAVGLTPTGDLHVVWTRYDTGVGAVYHRVWRRGGWASPPERLSPATGYAGYPALAVTPAGVVQVVWYGIRPGTPAAVARHGALYEIFATENAGQAWSPPQLISPGLPDSVNPAVAADAEGRVHAAWFQFDGRAYQVRYARWAGRWEHPTTVLRSRADQFDPDVAVDPAGHVVVVWEHHAGSLSRIYSARWAGGRWEGPVPLSGTTESAFHPVVAVGASGIAAAAWDAEDGQVYLRSFRETWGPAVRVTGAGRNAFPSVLLEGSGVDVVWTRVSPPHSEVRFARVPVAR